jgi:hypothetical protein
VETTTTSLARHAGFDRQSQSTTVPLARRLRRSIHPAAALSPVAITGISSSPTSTPIIHILSRVPLHHRSIDNIDILSFRAKTVVAYAAPSCLSVRLDSAASQDCRLDGETFRMKLLQLPARQAHSHGETLGIDRHARDERATSYSVLVARRAAGSI